jgi:hypothetical protein
LSAPVTPIVFAPEAAVPKSLAVGVLPKALLDNSVLFKSTVIEEYCALADKPAADAPLAAVLNAMVLLRTVSGTVA